MRLESVCVQGPFWQIQSHNYGDEYTSLLSNKTVTYAYVTIALLNIMLTYQRIKMF